MLGCGHLLPWAARHRLCCPTRGQRMLVATCVNGRSGRHHRASASSVRGSSQSWPTPGHIWSESPQKRSTAPKFPRCCATSANLRRGAPNLVWFWPITCPGFDRDVNRICLGSCEVARIWPERSPLRRVRPKLLRVRPGLARNYLRTWWSGRFDEVSANLAPMLASLETISDMWPLHGDGCYGKINHTSCDIGFS